LAGNVSVNVAFGTLFIIGDNDSLAHLMKLHF
jgi:hypothetical protein